MNLRRHSRAVARLNRPSRASLGATMSRARTHDVIGAGFRGGRRSAAPCVSLAASLLVISACGTSSGSADSSASQGGETASTETTSAEDPPAETPSSGPDSESSSESPSDAAPYGYLDNASDVDYDVNALIESLPGWNFPSLLPHNHLVLVDSENGVAVRGYIIYQDHFHEIVEPDRWGDIPIDPDWPEPVIWIDGDTHEVLRHDIIYDELVPHVP